MDLSSIQVIFFKSLLNYSVLDAETGKVLGRVEQIWLDKDQHQVFGLTYRSWRWDKTLRSLFWKDVEAVDEIGIWVTVSDDSLLVVQPKLSVDYQLGDPIRDCSGKNVGHLVDYRFNAKTGKVLDYLWLHSEDNNSCKVLQKMLPTAYQEGRLWLIHQDDIERTIPPPSTFDHHGSLSLNRSITHLLPNIAIGNKMNRSLDSYIACLQTTG